MEITLFILGNYLMLDFKDYQLDILKVWKNAVKIRGFRLDYAKMHYGNKEIIDKTWAGWIIQNSYVTIIWDKEDEFRLLSIDLNKLSKKSRNLSKILSYTPFNKETLALSRVYTNKKLYDYVMQLLSVGYNTYDDICLEDLDKLWKGYYIMIDKNKVIYLTTVKNILEDVRKIGGIK